MFTSLENVLAPVDAGMHAPDRTEPSAAERSATEPSATEPASGAPPAPLSLLIVDDEPGLPEALSSTFEDCGYRVLVASSGSGAVKVATEHSIDIALIDLVLPDVSGYELVDALRSLHPSISCIMMTAFASFENVIAAANMNVRGFVLKPLDLPAVLMKVKEAAAFQKLEHENSDLLAALRTANTKLEKMYNQEHRIADRLRRALLPTLPKRFGPFEVGDHYQAGVQEAQIGGDLYDLIELGDGFTGLMIADVSGKGLNAAVQTGMVRYSLRALAMLSLDPGEVITSLNRVICSHEEFSGFVTLFYGVFDRSRNVLSYVNAGHEPPLLLSGPDDEVAPLDTTGPVVGVTEFGDTFYEAIEQEMAPGDILMLFTDGLCELRGLDAAAMVQRLQEWLPEMALLPAPDAARSMFIKARDVSGGHIQDDLAIMLLKYLPSHA